MNPDPDGVPGALAGDGYVLLPYRGNGDPGDAISGFDVAGSVSLVVVVDGEATTVDVLIESSPDGDTWSTLNDFSGLDHANSPAIFHADTPDVQLRATVTGSANRVEVRAFPHAGVRSAAVLDADGAFTNVTKPSVADATAAALLDALVALGLVTDDT